MAYFDENTRVNFPATIQFLRLGYDYQSLKDCEIDINTRIFKERFKASIERINNVTLTDAEVASLITEIHNLIKRKDMGKEFYRRIIQPGSALALVDFENIQNNDFAVVDELTFAPEEGDACRPDINILINGIPLGFLEVKMPDNPGGIQREFHRMIDERLRKPEQEKFFNLLQFITFSNNMEYEDTDDTAMAEEIRAGSFYSTPNGQNTYFNFFREQKDTEKTSGFQDVSVATIKYILKDNGYSESEYDAPEFQTNLDPFTPCNKFVTSFFEQSRLLYILHYGFCYVDCVDKQGNPYVEKHIMRYPQFFATQGILKRLESGGKSGIIWHTQGSGKTELAAYANRIIRDYYAKKNIITRFFFVVDRLDLLLQAQGEFEHRGMTVTAVSDKSSFIKELNRTMDSAKHGTDLGSYTCVNIQKIMEHSDMPSSNDYNANIQRIFFIDEAHRSYRKNGEYFKNLMCCDVDGVFIALTGTPLLSKKERSNLKFGDYIHKYFYDKSIADGYTLRIKKEQIDTVRREEIHRNLQMEDPNNDPDVITESDAYLCSLCKYIEDDFINFRYTNNDMSIGGMIVCDSNPQAKAIGNWFEHNSKLATGVVLSDPDEKMQAQKNKSLQLSFKNNGTPDILIVHMMLTTGYDVRRLKKMYLLRNAHKQSLLQTISRVNRPYKAPNGKVYEYGYIMDFVDIEEEYERTLADYLQELETESGMDDAGEDLSGLIVSPEDIYTKYKENFAKIRHMTDMADKEKFRISLLPLGKEDLYVLRRAIRTCCDCCVELKLSRSPLADQIDTKTLRVYLKLVQHRIDLLNLQHNPTDTMQVISNKEVVEIIYEFIKTRVIILNLGKLAGVPEDNPDVQAVVDTLGKLQKSIQNNHNRNQSELVKLDKLLQTIFAKLDFKNIDELAGVNDELLAALKEMERINAENERLAAKFGGKFAFVKTLTDCAEQHSELNRNDIETVMTTLYESIKDVSERNTLLLQGRENFIAYNKKKAVTTFVKNGLFKKLQIAKWLDGLLSDLYTNLQLCN